MRRLAPAVKGGAWVDFLTGREAKADDRGRLRLRVAGLSGTAYLPARLGR